MTDDLLIDTLVDNYSSQYRIYNTLLDSLRLGVSKIGSADLTGIIPLLEARNRDFDAIKAMDAKTEGAKVEWEKRGGSIHTIQAETLRTLLGNIRIILSDVLETNKQLESKLSVMVGKR